MNSGRSGVGFLVALSCSVGVTQAQVPEFETAEEIIDYVDHLWRGESSRGVVVMDILTSNWSRSLEMESWSLGKDYSLVRVTAPKSEEGTATPQDRPTGLELPPPCRSHHQDSPLVDDGFVDGIALHQRRLVKESQLIDDYDIVISFDGARDGEAVWEFTLTPKPEAPVVWGRIEQQVRQRDLMPMWARYYDEDGNVSRTMTFSEFTTMGGRLVPSVMTVIPEDEPTESTTITYRALTFDIGIDRDFFSLRNLKETE